MSDPVVILGLGFTTQRLARRLRRQGRSVYAVVRDSYRFAEFSTLGVQLCLLSSESPEVAVPKDAVLVHSVPPLTEPGKSAIQALIRKIAPRRILYISSTGVYGAHDRVSEQTPAAPNDEKGRARLEEEEWIAEVGKNRWSALILRSAAIYGPGRGVHERLRQGRWQEAMAPRGAGGIISRIHVDDLVALLEAGINSEIGGAWPVADENPAPSKEVVAWCAEQMEITIPEVLEVQPIAVGRNVDGRKIRELLGVRLKYPSYREGITASLLENRDQAADI